MLESQGRRRSASKQPGVAEVLIALERGETLPAVQTSPPGTLRASGESGAGLASSPNPNPNLTLTLTLT